MTVGDRSFPPVLARTWHGCALAPPSDPLDANCRRAPQPDDLGCQQGLPAVVPGSGCASALPCILLDGADAQVSEHLTWWTGRAESDPMNGAIAQRTCIASVLAADLRVFRTGTGQPHGRGGAWHEHARLRALSTTDPSGRGRDQLAHPNEDLVREAYAAFGRGDMDALRNKYFTENVLYHVTGRSPLAGDYEGIDQVLQFFRPGLRGAGRHVQLRAA